MASQQQPTLRWATLVVVIVAGAWTLFHLIWNFAGQKNDDYWGIALLILFVLALILAFVQFFQERSALQAASSAEQFPEPPVGKFFLASAGSAPLWFVVRMVVGAEWLLSGWAKIQSPDRGTSGKALSGFVAGALAKTAGPHFIHQLFSPHACALTSTNTRGLKSL